jgi:hypothetical protein
MESNMSGLRDQLRRNKTVRGRRWVVKRNVLGGEIIEVKMIFKPEEYKNQRGAKPMIGDKRLLEILEKEFACTKTK